MSKAGARDRAIEQAMRMLDIKEVFTGYLLCTFLKMLIIRWRWMSAPGPGRITPSP